MQSEYTCRISWADLEVFLCAVATRSNTLLCEHSNYMYAHTHTHTHTPSWTTNCGVLPLEGAACQSTTWAECPEGKALAAARAVQAGGKGKKTDISEWPPAGGPQVHLHMNGICCVVYITVCTYTNEHGHLQKDLFYTAWGRISELIM